MALTNKQQRFVDEYLVDFNASQAAIRAGYSEKTAGAIGFENLKKPEIQAAIVKAIKARSERTEIDQDYVLKMLVMNLERSLQIEAVTDRSGEEIGEFVYQGSVANRALELLGKHLSMFTEKIESDGLLRVIVEYETDGDEDKN